MQTESIDISVPILDPANVRQHSTRNLESVKASLSKFGQQKPIVIDAKGVVVAGNATLAAARSIGWEKIDVVRTKLKGVEAKAYAIADNRTSELAEWDSESLPEILAEMKNDSEALCAATGFSDEEISSMLDSLRKPAGEAWDDAMASVPAGDQKGACQWLFILTKSQIELVTSAVKKAKMEPFANTGNPNANGNALARLAEAYLGRG